MKSTIMIAATGSNSGKTTFVTGFLEALKQNIGKYCSLRAFKCGPDYIDPMFHRSVLSIESTNLDAFFLDEEKLKYVFSENAGDINVIESAMGLYDGIGVTKKTSAMEIAEKLGVKIILLVNGRGMGYSIVPLIRGFLSEDRKKLIVGVVINRISEGYYKKIAPVIEKELSIKVFGCIPAIKGAELPSRHLGLVTPCETDFENKVSLIANQISKTVDIETIIAEGRNSACNHIIPDSRNYSCDDVIAENKNAPFGDAVSDTFNYLCNDVETKNINNHSAIYFPSNKPLAGKVICVAKDEAFAFCYKENIKLLEKLGACIEYFSPLKDSKVNDSADAIILYGGYPENYAKELSDNKSMLESIRAAADSNTKIIAECGGFMYLLDSLYVDEKAYNMAGIIHGYSKKSTGLVRFGYVNVYDENDVSNSDETGDIGDGGCSGRSVSCIKAHEFHHYEAYDVNYSDEYTVENDSTGVKYKGVVKTDNIFAGFPHLYYLSNPEFIVEFVK